MLANHAASLHRFLGKADVTHLVRTGVGPLVGNAEGSEAEWVGRLEFGYPHGVLDRLIVPAKPLLHDRQGRMSERIGIVSRDGLLQLRDSFFELAFGL